MGVIWWREETKVDCIPSNKMIVDLMTKRLLLEMFASPIKNMGLSCTTYLAYGHA